MQTCGREELADAWCDGIEPDTYELDADQPYIAGEFWMDAVGGWRFKLDLTNLPRVSSPEEIDWEAIYPVRGKTGWLSVDTEARFISMDLSVRDEPERDFILRDNYPPTGIARDEPTPEADIVSGDAWRSPMTTVHVTAPEPDPRNKVESWESLRATEEQEDDEPSRIRYWRSLEHRIRQQIRYSGRPELTNLEPDGMVVDAYEVGSTPPRIEGTCWFKRRRWWSSSSRPRRTAADAKLGPYRFVIALDSQPTAAAPADLDYDALLPEADRTGWLTVDLEAGLVTIDPAVRDEPTEDIVLSTENYFWIIPQGSSPVALTSDPDWRRTTPYPRTHVHRTAQPWATWDT